MNGYWDTVYEALARQPQLLWRRHSDGVNSLLLEDWLPPVPWERTLKTDLFDEALADGLYPQLSALCHRVTAIDSSTAVVEAARNRYPELDAVRADVRALPFTNESFDVVVSNSTLDHFPSKDHIALALRELVRVLAPAGRMIISLDNLANPVVWVRNALPFSLTNGLGLVPYRVGASHGPAGLTRALGDAGLRVLEVRAIMHCPRALAVPAAGLLERRCGARTQERFLRALMGWERLQHRATRFRTGHFVAAVAVKRR